MCGLAVAEVQMLASFVVAVWLVPEVLASALCLLLLLPSTVVLVPLAVLRVQLLTAASPRFLFASLPSGTCPLH